MSTQPTRINITRSRWVTFYESGAVVHDRFAGVYDAFELIPSDHPARLREEQALIQRLRRLYAA